MMKCSIGDLIISKQGSIGYIHDTSINVAGTKAYYITTIKKSAHTIETLPGAIVDYVLGEFVEEGKYKVLHVLENDI